MNLALNGRDAMPKGGVVSVSTHDEDLARARALTTGPVEIGRYLVLSVEDEGTGIDPAIRDQLFTPFFTTKPRDKGTGLGLATLYRIVRDAGGQIDVHSEPGRGARFDVWLPATTQSPTRATEPSSEAPRRGSETVLLVEDERLVRTSLASALQRAGYEVITAANATEALERVGDGEAIVDIAVTDVSMPGRSGIELASELHARWPELPVLFMTGFAESDLAERHPGAIVLEKPFSRDVLTAAIRRRLDGSG